jgi:hypothetical protein
MNNYFKIIIDASKSINAAVFIAKVPSELYLSKKDLASILKNYLYSEEYRIHIAGTLKASKDALSLKELKDKVATTKLYKIETTTRTFWKDDVKNTQVFSTPEYITTDCIERVVYEEGRTWSFFSFRDVPMVALDMKEVIKHFTKHGVRLKKAASSTEEITYYCCPGSLYIEGNTWSYIPQEYAFEGKSDIVLID